MLVAILISFMNAHRFLLQYTVFHFVLQNTHTQTWALLVQAEFCTLSVRFVPFLTHNFAILSQSISNNTKDIIVVVNNFAYRVYFQSHNIISFT